MGTASVGASALVLLPLLLFAAGDEGESVPQEGVLAAGQHGGNNRHVPLFPLVATSPG